MIILVSVSLFDYQPQHCPFGHELWTGMGPSRLETLHLYTSAGRDDAAKHLASIVVGVVG
jgi:hypothetical protein